jgi:3-methyladenine DNA glycosylase AlkC
MKAQSTFSLKDRLFNAEKLEGLAALLASAHPAFPRDAFLQTVLSALPSLQLKQRIAHITATLRACLPDDYREALAIILAALPPELDPQRSDDDYCDFIIAPFSLFVAHYGRHARDLDVSLPALREVTKRFSAEDAVRYFLNAFPDETLAFLEVCASDEHYHVRRLASEGTRPLLPWSQRLTIDHRRPLPILDRLFTDSTRYVTRSVANHLNDVSRIEPALVTATLERWKESGAQAPREMQFITTHALRTLVKRADAGALAMIGAGAAPDIDILEFSTDTPEVPVGDAFRFTLSLRARRSQTLLIDYELVYAGGSRNAGRRIFRLKRLELAAGESATISKSHPMRLMTTRRLHAGEHRVTVQINGRPQGTLAFELRPA